VITIKSVRPAISALIAASVFVTSAHAANLTWTINDFNYSGHFAGLTGSFDYDADTGVFSNINITSSAQLGFTYTDPNVSLIQWHDGTSNDYSTYPYPSLRLITDVPGELHDLHFFFSDQLTNNGGTISLVDTPYGTTEDICFNDGYGCSTPSSSFYTGLDGTGTISAVPIPAAAWLFGSALAGLGWMRRKQTT
jgi:hypothetical protein